MPLGTFLIGAFEPLYYIGLRKKYFKLLSGNLIFQFTFISLLKILFAYLGIQTLGLILGHVIGYIAGILLLTSLLVRNFLSIF